MKSRKSQGWLRSIWLQGALMALAALALWWLRRRESQITGRRTEIWRRDVELGPVLSSEETRAMTAEIEIPEQPAQTIPDVGAGSGSAAETAGLSEAGQHIPAAEVPVEGPPPQAQPQPQETPGGDDLEIVEGIGPKINQILQQAGIRTFKQLAETEVDALEAILRGVGLRIANPATWPEQARLAAAGEWSKLEAFQSTLKAGRRG